MTPARAKELHVMFTRASNTLGVGGSRVDVEFASLVKRYNQGRHYHTMDHVSWALSRLPVLCSVDGNSLGSSVYASLVMAIFFHDAVMNFDEFSFVDEEASAALAIDYIGERCGGYVANLIRATSHDGPPQTNEQAVVWDADISILGCGADAFADYERRVRLEWAHVPVEEFRKARVDVLERFLSMPRIFHTQFGHSRWEMRARANFLASIETTWERYQ